MYPHIIDAFDICIELDIVMNSLELYCLVPSVTTSEINMNLKCMFIVVS